MAAAPFLFQILLAGLKDVSPENVNRSIVVEVDPALMAWVSPTGEKAKIEREFAEVTARAAAAEIIRSEFSVTCDRLDSLAQIGSLPDKIRARAPILQRAGVRAWLL